MASTILHVLKVTALSRSVSSSEITHIQSISIATAKKYTHSYAVCRWDSVELPSLLLQSELSSRGVYVPRSHSHQMTGRFAWTWERRVNATFRSDSFIRMSSSHASLSLILSLSLSSSLSSPAQWCKRDEERMHKSLRSSNILYHKEPSAGDDLFSLCKSSDGIFLIHTAAEQLHFSSASHTRHGGTDET